MLFPQFYVQFANEHCRLYATAQSSGDYGECIAHYYSVMSKVIDEYFSGSFHFVPPLLPPIREKSVKLFNIPLSDSLRRLHIRIGQCLELSLDKNCVDIGCGIGDVIQHLAFTGANFTGLTIASNEVQIGNAKFRSLGLHTHCRLLEADCAKELPLGTASQDAAYALYSLKYIPNLAPIFAELARIIKPGGLLSVYDLLRTDKFNPKDEKQKKLLSDLEFACGMPPMHSRTQLIDEAARAGFTLVRAEDLQTESGLPFFHCFSRSPLFMWMMRSSLIGKSIKVAQTLKILPRGFHRFNKIFLAGTISKIVRAGQMGIMSGSEMLLFQRE